MLAILHAFAFAEDEAWGPDAMALTLELPGTFGLLCPGAGMILVRVVRDQAEVLTLAVAAPRQRRGTGAALLEAGMAAARQSGAGEIFLEVSTANGVARRLYERFGFTEVGRRPRYYADGTDALIMRAILPSGATEVREGAPTAAATPLR